MNNYHNIIPPSCRVWIPLSNRAFGVYLCVNMCLPTPIFISRYSDSFSWWSQISRKFLKLHKYKTSTICFSHHAEYGYCCPIDPFIYFHGWILVDICSFIFHAAFDLVSWWPQNSRKMALAPKIWRITTIFFSHLVDYGYRCPIDPLKFLWLNLGPATPIFMFCDSYSVFWW